MMMIINKYKDFINESKLELLLEANITLDSDFVKILNNIKSPISDQIKSLVGKEVDINTNYISFHKSKDDKILFKPDDKVKKVANWVYDSDLSGHNPLAIMTAFIDRELKDEFVFKGSLNDIYSKKVVNIIEIDQDKIREIIKKSNYYNKEGILRNIENDEIVIITWNDDDADCYSLIQKKELIKDIYSIKSSEMSIGRFARALLKKANIEVTDKDIEQFVNQYKTAIRIRLDIFKSFYEVNSLDIKKYYSEEFYYNTTEGSLGNSCMKHYKCQKFLDIYSKNPNQVSLIIMKVKNNGIERDIICARALLWTDKNGRKFMDRIYTNDSSHERLFIEYAINNGYYYKEAQNYKVGTLVFNEVVEKGYFKVYLENDSFDKYPYMDTLKFYDISENSLSSESPCGGTDGDYNLDGIDEDCLILTNTNGGHERSCESCDGSGISPCHRCDSEGTIECQECNGNGSEDCSECSGTGDHRCGRCDGEGTVDDEECSECSGSGTNTCSECNGSGNQVCTWCDGDGTITCDLCYGEGEHDCMDCDANY